jgi:hypothetical protein
MPSNDIRSHEQNKKFHALVTDIANQLRWNGEKWDAETWKRLLLAAKFGQTVMTNPLTGHGIITVNNRRSHTLTIEEMNEFICEIEAFGAQNAVDWSDDEDDVQEPQAFGSRP